MNAKLLERKWLSKEGPKNILVRLVIPSGKVRSISYKPGDHAVVFPINTDEDVHLVLQRMNKLPSDPYSVVQLHEYSQEEGFNIFTL